MADEDAINLDRRDLIKLGAAATLAASIGVGEVSAEVLSAQASAPGSFLTADELALLDELSELIIPADDHSPGARAARVAAYINARLSEAWDQQERIDWREGLKRIDQLAREATGQTFLQSTATERVALLTRIARNENEPKQPEEMFFVKLKSRVVNAYYTSEIGIKQEMDYKGNSYLTEFSGTDVS